jgi:hypothetical protein
MANFQVQFDQIKLGATFIQHGTTYFKRSSRTAVTETPVEYAGQIKYFTNKELAEVKGFEFIVGYEFRTYS